MKNPFKKKSAIDTLVNVGIGGAANVAIDYAWDMLGDTVSGIDDTTKNIIKIAGGALVGSMISNKYGRAAADGVATVGVSNLVSSLISSDKEEETTTTSGLPAGTIGRVIPRVSLGNRTFKKRGAKLAGDFMCAD